MTLRPWLVVLCAAVIGCDSPSARSERAVPVGPDPMAPIVPAIVPPGAEITGSSLTVDEEGRTVRVTTFEAPLTSAADLASLRASCARADHAACASLADALLTSGAAAEAEEVWYRSCLAGHGPSCADLGYQYNNPHIDLAHPERALDVLTRACDAPEHPPITCASLAERYADDAQTRFGTPPDPTRHRQLLERACRDGHYWSCDAIGRPPP